jgi:preprotein translocase subunit SecF
MKPIRLVPDNTHIRFMRGRFTGLIASAVLSVTSLVLFVFYPGLNYSVDFGGGVVIQLRLPQSVDIGIVRTDFDSLGFGAARVQDFGASHDVLIRLDRRAEAARGAIQAMLAAKLPGANIRRFEVVGARVSTELFHNGLLAVGFAFVGVLIYIWLRFDWQFGVGVVGTLLLDITKTVGSSPSPRFRSIATPWRRSCC